MHHVVVAGIDAGQRFLDLGLAPSGQTFRFANTDEDIAHLVARLVESGVARVVLEAVGSYAASLVGALVEAGLAVGIVNPRRIKAFRDAEGRRAKTDRLDAQLIARFALVMADAVRPIPDRQAQSLRALSTRRRQLTEMIAMEKTRLKQAREPGVLASHRAAIAVLADACKAIETEIAARIADCQERSRARDLLISIPGIGERVAAILIAELPELGQRDRKTIASLAGLAPHVTQSGNAPPRAAISGGRPCVRAALYMSALVAVRHDPAQKAAYAALRSQGKPAKVALVAVARRMLVTANAMLKTKSPYKPAIVA